MRPPLAALSLLLLSCGSPPSDVFDAGRYAVLVPDAGAAPAPGLACPTENVATCETVAAALFCERGTWARYACKGRDGCLTGATVRCDPSGAAPGDPCPVLWEASAVCRGSGDAGVSTERLLCNGGRWQSTKCPSACAESGGHIYCG